MHGAPRGQTDQETGADSSLGGRTGQFHPGGELTTPVRGAL